MQLLPSAYQMPTCYKRRNLSFHPGVAELATATDAAGAESSVSPDPSEAVCKRATVVFLVLVMIRESADETYRVESLLKRDHFIIKNDVCV